MSASKPVAHDIAEFKRQKQFWKLYKSTEKVYSSSLQYLEDCLDRQIAEETETRVTKVPTKEAAGELGRNQRGMNQKIPPPQLPLSLHPEPAGARSLLTTFLLKS